jgi:hypothetical protein
MNHTKLHDDNHNRTSRQRKHILHLVYRVAFTREIVNVIKDTLQQIKYIIKKYGKNVQKRLK